MAFAQQVQQVFLAEVAGSGVTIARYPSQAAGVALSASGKTTGAYKYAAANANVKQILAKGTLASGTLFRIVGCVLDTPSAASTFVIKLGVGTGAGTAINRSIEFGFSVVTVTAAGEYPLMPVWFRYAPTIVADGANDAILGDAASSNVAADDTINVAALVATGMGT
jgi:hypothetical protein